jgi:hypothetical protein
MFLFNKQAKRRKDNQELDIILPMCQGYFPQRSHQPLMMLDLYPGQDAKRNGLVLFSLNPSSKLPGERSLVPLIQEPRTSLARIELTTEISQTILILLGRNLRSRSGHLLGKKRLLNKENKRNYMEELLLLMELEREVMVL